MKCIHEIAPELLIGKKIIIRTDFNVSVSDKGTISETARIDAALKTITYLKNSKAKIIVMSHIGRNPEDSLLPIFEYLKSKAPISFVDTWNEQIIKEKTTELQNGEILLLPNLRSHPGEESNDPSFATFLASLADMYINDAFSVSHRTHASVVGITEHIKSYCGCQFRNEYENISKVHTPSHPFIVLMGGAKFETKIPVIEALLDKADFIFVGGALANDILKANGFEVGKSKVHDLNIEYAKKIFTHKKVGIVQDARVISLFSSKNKELTDITTEDIIIDGGKKTAEFLTQKIKEAQFVVWNGPFGTFEQGNSFLSKHVIQAISNSNSYSIVGGGDTVAEVKKLKKENVFDFISLSGGAMLEFIAEGTLPGIDALENGC